MSKLEMKPWWLPYQVTVPEGAVGRFEIKRFAMTQDQADRYNVAALFSHSRARAYPGDYTALWGNGNLWMSDTPDEIRDHMEFWRRAEGDILITGLGLGMALQALLTRPSCHEPPRPKSITVIERERDVIDLVGPHYRQMAASMGVELEIICANVYDYKPPKGRTWTCAWHDVWPTISADNAPKVGKIHRKFARRVEWQRSWKQDTVRRLRREDQRQSKGW